MHVRGDPIILSSFISLHFKIIIWPYLSFFAQTSSNDTNARRVPWLEEKTDSPMWLCRMQQSVHQKLSPESPPQNPYRSAHLYPNYPLPHAHQISERKDCGNSVASDLVPPVPLRGTLLGKLRGLGQGFPTNQPPLPTMEPPVRWWWDGEAWDHSSGPRSSDPVWDCTQRFECHFHLGSPDLWGSW